MQKIKESLTMTLLEILDLEATNVLKQFLEGECSVLFLLFRVGKKLSPKEIANELNISKGRVATLLNSLYMKGQIDILKEEADRRSFRVSLTKEGMSALGEKISIADGYFDKLVSKLGEEKTGNLIEILNETIRIMKEE